MRLQQLLLGGLAALTLAGGPLVAMAADAPPAGQSGKAWCKNNPDQCKQGRAKRAEFCKNNPDKCAAAKQRHDERRQFCKSNPEQCKAQREQFKARRDEMRAKCAAEPDKCEQIKSDARKEFQNQRKHMDKTRQPAG